MDKSSTPSTVGRRDFLKQSGVFAAAALAAPSPFAQAQSLSFKGPDSLVHGPEWESLNPGFWQIKNGALRRRFKNYGDRARGTGFPYHYETHGKAGGVMPVEYDPSLPFGIIYRRDYYLEGSCTITANFTYHGRADVRRDGDNDAWKMYQKGYGLFGLAVGAKSVFESYGKVRQAYVIGWTDSGQFGIVRAPKNKFLGLKTKSVAAPALTAGDVVEIAISVKMIAQDWARLVATLKVNDQTVTIDNEVPANAVKGYFGVASKGLTDVGVNSVRVDAAPRDVGTADCLVCYPLGDTLKQQRGKWRVRFVGLFGSDGKTAEIRVADKEQPKGGWNAIPVCGKARIVSNRWRRNTATIEVTLPFNPSTRTLYYTVWKDGKNVTTDPRIGTAACGPGTGMVGDVPKTGSYVGRLPQLTTPYKLCGLSCHALTSGLQQRTEDGGYKILGGGDDWQFRDQPSVESYKHLEDYDFQVMVWEDDVWYMELMLYPPSTDDAYKVVAFSIAGPTSRWQMMRHWNVINPGDHDYGMDDVKGPEQIAIRTHEGLGQDPDYMRRNFQIVHHLVTGDEEVDPLANPKKWRAWKMPDGDFTLAVVDARLWRSSQDTAIWDDEGWGHNRTLYDRKDPTRALLGEEQFAWLQQLVRTDASRLICLTGLNALHTIWTGGKKYSKTDEDFPQRDRVAADYAGWVAAGADRVIELLGSRDGIVTVYGDVHNGSIIKNTDHNLIECSFGPIGRSGGRDVIKGFGPSMKDFDGRPLEVSTLYHKTYADPTLGMHGAKEPFYWNFLEMEFDPSAWDPKIGLRIRNLIDAPGEVPRGGVPLNTVASATGRAVTAKLPAIKILSSADVLISYLDGRPIRGATSDANGAIIVPGLIGPAPGEKVLLSAHNGKKAEAQIVTLLDA